MNKKRFISLVLRTREIKRFFIQLVGLYSIAGSSYNLYICETIKVSIVACATSQALYKMLRKRGGEQVSLETTLEDLKRRS